MAKGIPTYQDMAYMTVAERLVHLNILSAETVAKYGHHPEFQKYLREIEALLDEQLYVLVKPRVMHQIRYKRVMEELFEQLPIIE